MSRVVAFLLSVLAVAGWAQPVAGPPLTGVTSTINDGPGDQVDPHVSGELVAYSSIVSGTSEIRYHNILTGQDQALPTEGGLDFLSDISGTTIVYTHLTSGAYAIRTFDIATGGPPVDLAPVAGSLREQPAIGSATVAWVDYGVSSAAHGPEIVAYDRVAGTAARLTNDDAFDTDPAVSPDGSSIVFTKCATYGSGCDIWEASRVSGQWAARQLTGSAGEEGNPDTSGRLVVYGSTRAEESDIYWQPVGGGPETRLVLPGSDRNPSIAESLIAFEHFDASASTPNWDIYLHDVSTNILYRLTSGLVDEVLSDISVDAAGVIRVVWTAQDTTDANVYALSLALPSACRDLDLEQACQDPSRRPLLATLEVSRSTGKPNRSTMEFSASSSTGLLCIDNFKATSGEVSVNCREEVGPDSFKQQVTLIARELTELRSTNSLKGVIAGKPGTHYTIRVYGEQAACGSSPDGFTTPESLHVAESTVKDVQSITGVQMVARGTGELVLAPVQPLSVAGGCSSVGGGLALWGMCALLGLWFCRRAAAVVRIAPRR